MMSPYKRLEKERDDYRQRCWRAKKVVDSVSLGSWPKDASISGVHLQEEVRVAGLLGYAVEIRLMPDGRLNTFAVKRADA